jgi:signal transduction histidine kinase
MLQEFVEVHRDELIRRCRDKVSRRSLPLPTEAEITHGVPLFLDQLVAALRSGGDRPNPAIADGALLHGQELLRYGFTVSQVVHDYGDVCQSITELALEVDAPIATEDFRTLNRCLDDAIASAVTEFSRASRPSQVDGRGDPEHHRLGFFAHELRNLVNTAVVAFEVLKKGEVGVGGSTAAIVDRSLMGLRALISRALVEVRLTEGVQSRERIAVGTFVIQIAAGAALEAAARGIRFDVRPIEDDLAIEGDPLVLAAVVNNLLQNAFKFTRPDTTVTLRIGASRERVLIQVEDQCGGLPGGEEAAETLFRAFEQRGADRTGFGLGLAFSRWGTAVNGGRLYARNNADGCAFIVDLPRLPARRVRPAGPLDAESAKIND